MYDEKGPNMLPVGDTKWLQMGRRRKKKANGVKNRPNMERKKTRSLCLKMGHEGKRAKVGGEILSEGKSQTESGQKRTNASMINPKTVGLMGKLGQFWE